MKKILENFEYSQKLNKIKNIERNFRPPDLPIFIIRLYRIFKKIFNANK